MPIPNNWKALAVFLVALALISFPLHLAWEWWQCRPYFVMRAAPVTLALMLMATMGDVMLTLLAYVGMSTIHGAGWPLRHWPVGVWLTLLGLALILSIVVENYALQTGRWAYTEAAPRLPGASISVLPVAQLLILFPLSFIFARSLTRRVVRSGLPQ